MYLFLFINLCEDSFINFQNVIDIVLRELKTSMVSIELNPTMKNFLKFLSVITFCVEAFYL